MIQRRAEDVADDVRNEDAIIEQIRNCADPQDKATLQILHNIGRGLRETNRLVADVFERLDKQDAAFAKHIIAFTAHAGAEDNLFNRMAGAAWVMSGIGASAIGLFWWFLNNHLADMTIMQAELRTIREENLAQTHKIRSLEQSYDLLSNAFTKIQLHGADPQPARPGQNGLRLPER